MNPYLRVLLVDDSPADVALAREAWPRTQYQPEISSVPDGDQALAYLARTGGYANVKTPDLIILDLNLPRRNGRTVLADLKSDPKLRTIPVVVFSTSRSPKDVTDCYRLGANCYVMKPGNLEHYFAAIRLIDEFWLACASLPEGES